MPVHSGNDTKSKRQIILDAALDLFSRKGYEETTVADIVLGVFGGVGSVYLYFRNKHEIYTNSSHGLLAKIAEAFRNPVTLALPFEQMPRAIIEETFDICRKNKQTMSLLHVEMRSPEELREHCLAVEQITNSMQAFFDYAIAQGQLAPFNTTVYAKLLNSLVDGVLHECFQVEGGKNEEFYREGVIEFIERLFFGPSIKKGETQ